MVSFWEAVVHRLTPNITGEEGLWEMRRGFRALARVVWDLRFDREHPLARTVVGRMAVDCGG